MNIGMGEEEWNSLNIKNYDYSVSSVQFLLFILDIFTPYQPTNQPINQPHSSYLQ